MNCLDTSSELKLNKSLLTIRIVYFAFIISLAIYLFIPNLFRGYHISFEGSKLDLLKNILYLISVLTAIVILILRRFLNKMPLIPKSNIDEILRPLISGNIVIFTLCETIGLYGLVLFLIDGMLEEFYFLTGVSFILLIICFPKREKWERVVSQFM